MPHESIVALCLASALVGCIEDQGNTSHDIVDDNAFQDGISPDCLGTDDDPLGANTYGCSCLCSDARIQTTTILFTCDDGSSLDTRCQHQCRQKCDVPAFCNDSDLPCNFEFPGINPAPYEKCSGLPFYSVCHDGSCIPESGSLRTFYETWIDMGPELLGVSVDVFRRHVTVNSVSAVLVSGSPIWLFRIDYLITHGWIVRRASTEARVPDLGQPATEEFEAAIRGDDTNYYSGLPASTLEYDEVLKRLHQCDSRMEADYCHINLSSNASGPDVGFRLFGYTASSDQSAACKTLLLDLQTGAGECVPSPCAAP